MLAEDTFRAINGPIEIACQRASGLRFGDVRVHALWHAIILFRQLAAGFRAAGLRDHLAALAGRDPEAVSQGAITYQLRRRASSWLDWVLLMTILAPLAPQAGTRRRRALRAGPA